MGDGIFEETISIVIGEALLFLWLLFIFSLRAQADEARSSAAIVEAFAKVESLNSMREGLSDSLGHPRNKRKITEEDFNQVCAPVGKAFKNWVSESTNKGESLVARQVSARFRNPLNEPNKRERSVMREFYENKNLKWKVEDEELEGIKGIRMYRRITVDSSCRHCHGSKENRPQFVKDNYPNDKAYGFTTGSLRGLYSIWIKNR